MEKKQFQAESQRLMDLMVNSIYTHKEIFLRELLSNASDAIDKLAYRALTDEKVGLNRDDFQIAVKTDPEARTITVADNGIGMTREEMESNLGTIAHSGSLQFKNELDAAEGTELDIIGQFGVGFYSAFMVADKVTVTSKAYGSDEAWRWESEGVEGYTIEPCDKQTVGTEIVLHVKADEEEGETYSPYLETGKLSALVKKYSDYIRYPIRMDMKRTRAKEKPADAPEDYKPEYEDYTVNETVNSMVPLWQRPKAKVTDDEYKGLYHQKFSDWEDPLLTTHIAAEGTLEYKAILFVPSHATPDYYTKSYQKGLQLYSSGVLIMEKCADLLPDYFSFVQGVVDTPDVSLNLSREMLQHDRQLKVIAKNLEKKIKSELLQLQKDDREKYETFWKAFGLQLKYGVMVDYGVHKDAVQELLLFWSSKENKLVTLSEYVERMPESQKYIYYVCADSVEKAAKMPQAERILDAGFEVLYLVQGEDEFVLDLIHEVEGKPVLSVSDPEALPQTDEEKTRAEQEEQEYKEVLDFVKETLGDRISAVRISRILKTGPVCMTADGPVSLEMEKYMSRMQQAMETMKASRVLELNAESPVFTALRKAVEEDKEKAKTYAEVLYHQALLLAGLPMEDPAHYTELVCSLLQ